ncbi:hypothetical protein GPA27_12485 [Aromatoleum toluolicum]|uniref:Toprim domain-containing protein n=1 Tax=Aromatoleum toluolicum TaxID=90060 RepID=A0ABX1NFX0_9RHOO|nr:toprim domain-containing protein [Aromatoleum toluolicum]NMF98202.1 hypothetical protein [Aromatoleum toluolicum]
MSGFINFARTHDVEIRELHPSDRICRCPTTAHPRSKNGAYWFDGTRGWVQNWETGEPVQWWNDPAARPWTEADKAQWVAQRQAADEARLLDQQRASARAAQLIAQAATDTHGYLKAKGFPEVKGLVLPDGSLTIPMRDVTTNALLGAQVIRLEDNRWQKKMLPGMRAKGAVFVIGPRRAAEFVLCEGYVTGLSIAAAIRLLRLDISVMVCFSAQNLTYVAGIACGRRMVFADHDVSGTGEQAARTTGLPWMMSPTVGEDANDLHRSAGLLAVAKLIMHARKR